MLVEGALARPKEWDGGYIRYDAKGRATYYIAQMRDGRRYHFSTGQHNPKNAYLELVKFDANPPAYRRGGTADGHEPLYMTASLVDEYVAFCERPEDEEGAENTPDWVKRKRSVLEWWMKKFADERGRALDLRNIPPSFITTILDGRRDEVRPKQWKVEPATDKRTKRNVIKRFYSWLRQVRREVSRDQDPVMDLPVGKGRSSISQAGVRKDLVKPEHVKKVIEHGIERSVLYAHVLAVQAGTGWHTTEMMRFVARGSVEPIPEGAEEPGCVAQLVCPKHKSGKEHRTKVQQNVLDAAQALLASPRHHHRGNGERHGSFSRSNYEKWVTATSEEVGVPVFRPSWMRHTNATYALLRQRQADGTGKVGAFLGHAEGSKMVETHYAPKVAPPKIPTIMDNEPVQAKKARAPKKDGAVARLAKRLRDLEAKLAQRHAAPPDSVMQQLESMLAAMKAKG